MSLNYPTAIDKDLPFDASNPEAVAKQAKRSERFNLERAEVLKNVMSSVAGRAWAYEFLTFCNIFGNPFVPGASDSTSFNLGMQNVGKKLLDEINNAAPERYMPMLREAKQRESL